MGGERAGLGVGGGCEGVNAVKSCSSGPGGVKGSKNTGRGLADGGAGWKEGWRMTEGTADYGGAGGGRVQSRMCGGWGVYLLSKQMCPVGNRIESVAPESRGRSGLVCLPGGLQFPHRL